MLGLHQIYRSIGQRTAAIEIAHGAWPCRKGCSDCCRQLASEPLISEAEWRQVEAALNTLPPEIATAALHRVQKTAAKPRPVTCPLLDLATGACLIYDARPLACRTYGFYAEREKVLGCHRIETIASESPDIIWGNHRAFEADTIALGATQELSNWASQSPIAAIA